MTEQEKINGWTFEETVKTAENLMEVEKNMFKWDVLRHLRDFAENFKEELKQYRAIGTPEECPSAVEKQIPKKPVEMKPTDKLLNGYFACPMCGGWVGMDEYSNEYCGCCGQKINWSDEE